MIKKLLLPLLLSTAFYCGGGDEEDTGDIATEGGATEGGAPEGTDTDDTTTEGTTTEGTTTEGGDDDVTVFSCDEFGSPAGTIDTVPGTFSGDLNGSGADLAVVEGDCNLTGTFFDQPGEEQVIEITGLTVGSPYLLTAEAAESDISFYLTQGCDGSGFGNGLCELFVDNGGAAEATIFEATTASVYMVVDQFSPEASANGTYTVNICLLYTSPSPRDQRGSRMPSSA